ncbi:MAG: META domain-containing protein [Opitutaceae bacterium]|jgi:heat shock protein HslJ|nr:META domain-containing protein [Opitutaceae bacterium]
MKKFLPCLSLMLLFVAGCKPAGAEKTASRAPSATSKETLAQAAGKSWKLDRWVGVDGTARDPGPITMAVDENNRVSGNSGVNRYSGTVGFTGAGATDFGSNFVSTRMMGLPEAAARETRFLAELGLIRAAGLENGRLVLTGDGALRLEFAPAPGSAP